MLNTFNHLENQFSYDTATSVITLKAGATVRPANATFQANASQNLIALRNNFVDSNNTTTQDLSFSSLSACASFIVGGSKSGNVYFKAVSHLVTPDNATAKATANAIHDPLSPTQDDNEKSVETPTQTTNNNGTMSLELQRDKHNIHKDVNTFFVDCCQEVSQRMLNTMALLPTRKARKEYINNYMELIGKPQEIIKDAIAKMSSPEWKELEDKIVQNSNKIQMNKRLTIKYGKAGTGKTTAAINELLAEGIPEDEIVKLVASQSQCDDDIFATFNPDTKSFDLTVIGKAITEGRPIIIDEANLYNVPCLQRLQAVLDATGIFTDEKQGINLKIKEGFRVIMTMNLETNFGKTPLPSPLVDRAKLIENYDTKDDVFVCYW